jgi:hypothetical protein
VTLSASSRAVAIEFAATSTRTRELRHFAFRRLPFGAWKRCTNQPAMHGTIVLRLLGVLPLAFLVDDCWRSLRFERFVSEWLLLDLHFLDVDWQLLDDRVG